MEQIVVKTEMQSNGEILLFYVDENGENQEGVITTIENIENQSLQLQDENYIVEEVDEMDEPEDSDQIWSEEETKRLLVFYNDNLQSFISGATKEKHLWTVACKTMLIGKNPTMCEHKLYQLKTKYAKVCACIKNGVYVEWPFLELCQQVFEDDKTVQTLTSNFENQYVPVKQEPNVGAELVLQNVISNTTTATNVNTDNIVKTNITSERSPDEKVRAMLQLYLKYKETFQKEHWRRDIWKKIALEMGEYDGEYWQKRFLNFKNHYICMLEKRKMGCTNINWQYMDIFDQIFADNVDFHKKFGFEMQITTTEVPIELIEEEWRETEKTVLAKYCFDCYDEFLDPTIPKNFNWNEIGRLLDRPPAKCKEKFDELKALHLEKFIDGSYDLRSRKPLDILLDNIIAKAVEDELEKKAGSNIEMTMEEVDDLVQFVYENVEMIKDSVCYFVCWAAVAKKQGKAVYVCKTHWDELVFLYKSILADKKENSDMQIDWRYIELFDRIFDYGMDENMLNGYEKPKSSPTVEETTKVAAKKVLINFNENPQIKVKEELEDPTDLEIKLINDQSLKILEYYMRNKDKFAVPRNKTPLWQALGKQIGLNASQCIHKYRLLKQVYTEYIRKEITNPKQPISWPYFALCKKVFGVRAIKAKLKNGLMESNNEWTDDEVRRLILYSAEHFNAIAENDHQVKVWEDLAAELQKTDVFCKEKFLELRKSYRKLKTKKARNSDVKISWPYFSMMEQIFEQGAGEIMEVDDVEETYLEEIEEEVPKPEDEDYQCIIILPEGQEISDPNAINRAIENGQILVERNGVRVDINSIDNIQETEIVTMPRWNKRTKKLLLIHYINYIRIHKGKEINPKEMWADIGNKLDIPSVSCRKMFTKLKKIYTQDDAIVKSTPLDYLWQRILKQKPRFVVSNKSNALQETKTYRNVSMTHDKIDKALQYFLEHIEEFVSPKFEKKYLWTELANFICEPVSKVFNKINYMKQAYNIETEEIDGEKTPFSSILKDIIAKEVAVKIVLDVNQPQVNISSEDSWSDDETENLLEWYLSNLEKFKNPKFVRSYLWMEASEIMRKSALVCSKKMFEIRTQYKSMVKENSDELLSWKFRELCQKIYGTGKRNPAETVVMTELPSII